MSAIDFVKLEDEAKKFATKLTLELVEKSNLRPIDEIRTFAGLTSGLIFENLLCTFAADNYPPGSEAGIAWIMSMYEQAIKSTFLHWRNMSPASSIKPNQGPAH